MLQASCCTASIPLKNGGKKCSKSTSDSMVKVQTPQEQSNGASVLMGGKVGVYCWRGDWLERRHTHALYHPGKSLDCGGPPCWTEGAYWQMSDGGGQTDLRTPIQHKHHSCSWSHILRFHGQIIRSSSLPVVQAQGRLVREFIRHRFSRPFRCFQALFIVCAEMMRIFSGYLYSHHQESLSPVSGLLTLTRQSDVINTYTFLFSFSSAVMWLKIHMHYRWNICLYLIS